MATTAAEAEAALKSPITTSLVVIPAVFEGLATFIVALRFYLRFRITNQRVKLDDWLALLSLVASWGYALGIFIVAGQIGVNEIKVDPFTAAEKFVEAVAIGSILLVFVIVPIKISVLLFYKRIFVSPIFSRCVWVMITVVLSWGIACLVAQLLIAYPGPADAWENLEHPTYRFDYFKFGLSVPLLSIVFDGVILLFPLPSLRQLQMPLRRKISVICILWLGSFCIVTGAIRIHYWYKNAEIVTDPNNGSLNRWQYDTLVQIWVFLEMTVTIIAACLPTLAPLLTGWTAAYTRLTKSISYLSSRIYSRVRSTGMERSEGSGQGSGRFHRTNSADTPVIFEGSSTKSDTWFAAEGTDNNNFKMADVEMAHILKDHGEQTIRG